MLAFIEPPRPLQEPVLNLLELHVGLHHITKIRRLCRRVSWVLLPPPSSLLFFPPSSMLPPLPSFSLFPPPSSLRHPLSSHLFTRLSPTWPTGHLAHRPPGHSAATRLQYLATRPPGYPVCSDWPDCPGCLSPLFHYPSLSVSSFRCSEGVGWWWVSRFEPDLLGGLVAGWLGGRVAGYTWPSSFLLPLCL